MDPEFAWLVHSYWWLVFPFMGFAFGAFGMFMGYRMHRDRIELMKTYAAQGKDPAEIAKAMGGPAPGADPWSGGYYGYPGRWGGPWGGGWGWGPWGRYGPYREWRRFILFTCLAIGFGVASQWADIPGTERAFTLVAVIMGVLALGSFLFAIVSTVIASNMSKNDK